MIPWRITIVNTSAAIAHRTHTRPFGLLRHSRCDTSCLRLKKVPSQPKISSSSPSSTRRNPPVPVRLHGYGHSVPPQRSSYSPNSQGLLAYYASLPSRTKDKRCLVPPIDKLAAHLSNPHPHSSPTNVVAMFHDTRTFPLFLSLPPGFRLMI